MKKRSNRVNTEILTIKYIIISIVLFFILCIVLIQYFLHNNIESKETITITNHLRNIKAIYDSSKDTTTTTDVSDYHNLINKIKDLKNEISDKISSSRDSNSINSNTDDNSININSNTDSNSITNSAKILDTTTINAKQLKPIDSNIKSSNSINSNIVTTTKPATSTTTSNSIIKLITSSSSSSSSSSSLGLDTVLLIVASNRPQYLEKCLNYVIQYHPKTSVPIIITEDGNNNDVSKVVQNAKEKFSKIAPNIPFLHIHNPNAGVVYQNGYYNLAQHFKWALDSIFFNQLPLPSSLPSIKRVIILEEDLQISSDFYEYFESLKDMLDNDQTLLCVSAFNDNGFDTRVKDNKFLYRSDFFPGLGWMLPRRIWEEYSPIWPKAYWDDWLREPQRRKGRHIIRPEVSRTYHYGRKGVSNSEFGSFLDNIKLNDEFVKFSDLDLSYLGYDNWEKTYINAVKNSPIVTIDNYSNSGNNEVRIIYSSLEGGVDSFVHIAHWAGIMDNIKAGVPRTAYRGVVSTWKDGIKLHITPTDLQ